MGTMYPVYAFSLVATVDFFVVWKPSKVFFTNVARSFQNLLFVIVKYSFLCLV